MVVSTTETSNTCPHQCPEGYCIPLHLVCDGTTQCSDKSDEINCQTNTIAPSDIELTSMGNVACHQCWSDGYCIPLHLICNGKNECSDKSDEINCQINSMAPSETKFRTIGSSEVSACHQCPLGYCIPLHLICDGTPQCSDHSDEKYCQFPTITSIQPSDSEETFSNFKAKSTMQLFSSNKIKGMWVYLF